MKLLKEYSLLLLATLLMGIGMLLALLTLLGLGAAYEYTPGNASAELIMKYTATPELPSAIITFIRIMLAAGMMVLGFRWMEESIDRLDYRMDEIAEEEEMNKTLQEAKALLAA